MKLSTRLQNGRIAHLQRSHQGRWKHVYKQVKWSLLTDGHTERLKRHVERIFPWPKTGNSQLKFERARIRRNFTNCWQMTLQEVRLIINFEINMHNQADKPFVFGNRNWQLTSAGFSVCLHDQWTLGLASQSSPPASGSRPGCTLRSSPNDARLPRA